MTRMLRSERGQTMVITFLFLAVLLAISAAVVDVGAWYRLHRETQATADAAALAGAQELPKDTAAARTVAVNYGDKNGGGVSPEDVELSSSFGSTDTIKVTARKPGAGVFTKLFGIDSVTARASAKARVGVLSGARWAAPIGVDWGHEMLGCEGTRSDFKCAPTFNVPTEIDFEKVGPGAFRLLNIDGSYGGTSPPDIGEWIRTGYDGQATSGKYYYSDPGIKPNSTHIKDALSSRIGDGKEILIPIYSDFRAQGAGFEYWVVGWVGFRVDSFEIRGVTQAKITGSFTEIIWEGTQDESGDDNGLGARSVQLIE
jgi:hypothetical protein